MTTESVYYRYFLIILITVAGSLQVALNFRLSEAYWKENIHIIKNTLNVRFCW